ncbi:rhodanese-like domain-containing protein [Egbenema bharatensis]|uniref:rhodanese-like domain-containing protein n=1 Tax=Egbenema bharatensis TaxID=3463334 RepID=UPI003A8A0107
MSVSTLKPNVTHLTPEEFVQLAEPPQLIDVRSRLEFNLFHAPTAINLSLPRILMIQVPFLCTWLLPKWFWQFSKDQSIAVICLTAHRSPIAAQTLVDAGFTQVFNITGGMIAWKKAGLPTH